MGQESQRAEKILVLCFSFSAQTSMSPWFLLEGEKGESTFLIDQHPVRKFMSENSQVKMGLSKTFVCYRIHRKP